MVNFTFLKEWFSFACAFYDSDYKILRQPNGFQYYNSKFTAKRYLFVAIDFIGYSVKFVKVPCEILHHVCSSALIVSCI